MRYLKNNGQPYKIILNRQTKVGYTNKEGQRKEVRIVFWRDPNTKSIENTEAQEIMIPKDKKAILWYKIEHDPRAVGGIRKTEENEERKLLGYTLPIWDFPHVIGFTVGESHKDERIYNVMIGDTVEIENDDDAEELLKTFHFVDEVDKDGNILENEHKKTGAMVKGNPYKSYDNRKVDIRRAPLAYDELSRDAAPRANPLDKRVTEILKAGSEDEELIGK